MTKPSQICQTKPIKPNLPTKLSKPSRFHHTYETNSTKPNLPDLSNQTKLTKPNFLRNKIKPKNWQIQTVIKARQPSLKRDRVTFSNCFDSSFREGLKLPLRWLGGFGIDPFFLLKKT